VSRERLRRIERVLNARQRAADRLELELADLVRARMEALLTAKQARETWIKAMNVPQAERCSSTELSEAHGYAVTLGLRYEARAAEAREAEARCTAARTRLLAARSEVRKVELWQSRVIDARTLEDLAIERRATDELAARHGRTA
jgi:flagellar export protein FliJ